MALTHALTVARLRAQAALLDSLILENDREIAQLRLRLKQRRASSASGRPSPDIIAMSAFPESGRRADAA